MKLTHWKLGTVLLGVLILLCLVWWPEAEAPTPVQPVTTPDTAPLSEENPPLSVRPTHKGECEGCPSSVSFKSLKRSGPEGEERSDEYAKSALYAFAEEMGGCEGMLLKATLDGEPNPDTSSLGGCDGRTPLHVASTSDQVQALIDAGADVNARDRFGNTPLHVHAIPTTPTEDSLEVIDLLLEAGADASLKNSSGEQPWKAALLLAHTQGEHFWLHEKITKETGARGIIVEAYLASKPHLQEMADGLLGAYLVEAKIYRRLLAAAVASPAVAFKR